MSGLDRERLVREGADPAAAMGEAAEWVREQAGDYRPVLVGYPVVFDWMFVHWYDSSGSQAARHSASPARWT